jgi:hypothetical protein
MEAIKRPHIKIIQNEIRNYNLLLDIALILFILTLILLIFRGSERRLL